MRPLWPRPVNDELAVIDKALGQWGQTCPHGESLDAETRRQRRENLIIQFGCAHPERGDPASRWAITSKC